MRGHISHTALSRVVLRFQESEDRRIPFDVWDRAVRREKSDDPWPALSKVDAEYAVIDRPVMQLRFLLNEFLDVFKALPH